MSLNRLLTRNRDNVTQILMSGQTYEFLPNVSLRLKIKLKVLTGEETTFTTSLLPMIDQPYPGFFADMETRCQAWHYCDIDGRQTSFLCPNGTQFSQAVFICDWWFNVKCDLSPKLYAINERLYRKQPKENPIKPHREITKELVDSIFLRKRQGTDVGNYEITNTRTTVKEIRNNPRGAF